jgi:hypothetical protein
VSSETRAMSGVVLRSAEGMVIARGGRVSRRAGGGEVEWTGDGWLKQIIGWILLGLLRLHGRVRLWVRDFRLEMVDVVPCLYMRAHYARRISRCMLHAPYGPCAHLVAKMAKV